MTFFPHGGIPVKVWSFLVDVVRQEKVGKLGEDR